MPAELNKTKPGKPNRHTQAVIIFHGIGEQRPMDTLRSFADAILPEPEQGGEKYFSKPDPLSELFELRKLQDRSQPRTHFFEYYWAYQAEGTNFRHIISWLSTLLLRRPGAVPRQLRTLWFLSWLLIVAALAAAALGVSTQIYQFTADYPTFLVSGISTLLFGLLHGFVLLFLGDAARYLSPHPANIKLRQSIRADGIKLLRMVQDVGKYERIIVVGHSLGSVIAYDILKNLWQEYYEVYKNPKATKQVALAELEKVGEDLCKGTGEATIQDYRNAKVELWKELRDLGNPWLVTDFITLGSPLAHAALLLARDVDDLHARQRQRELPTDPPQPELETTKTGKRQCYSYRVWDGFGEKKDIKLRAVHAGGLFAITRWTNLYFPVRWGLLGDLVGGPLQPWFGPGIWDVAVGSGHMFTDLTLQAHMAYWDKSQKQKKSGGRRLPLSLPTLVEVLDLKNKAYFS